MSRARLGSYALWQLRDYALTRGVPTLIIGALLLFQIRLMMNQVGGGLEAVAFVSQLLATFVVIGALIAINGIISNDRRQGYYRFLFAKPLAIPRYYVQAFLIHGAGLVLGSALFLLAVWGVSGAATPARTVLYPALYYVLLGGLGFLFSSLLRNDWVLIVATLALTQVLRWRWADDPGALGWMVRWLLPPFHVFEDVRTTLLAGTMPEAAMMLWPLLYGALGVAAGVLVLRKRALGG